MSEIKNGGLDQYGAEPFEQQQLGTAGIEGVTLPKVSTLKFLWTHRIGLRESQQIKN